VTLEAFKAGWTMNPIVVTLADGALMAAEVAQYTL
jgi:hypothetical protein